MKVATSKEGPFGGAGLFILRGHTSFMHPRMMDPTSVAHQSSLEGLLYFVDRHGKFFFFFYGLILRFLDYYSRGDVTYWNILFWNMFLLMPPQDIGHMYPE